MRPPIFTAADVLRIAVKNELAGEAFYRQIAQRTPEPAVRDLFLLLADEEPRHAAIFSRMLAGMDDSQVVRADLDEYVGYMISYYTANVLFAENQADELPAAPDPVTALDFGIQRELDSIIYYTQVKELVPTSHTHQIDAIIAEERGHFLKFSKLKRTYLAKISQSGQ
ncbi:MAG: ferritin family protein [Kiritimatiellia bacterium]|jgi:rubrerythrin|nr:ferritin family protein [Kiritimatiellia bacterium]